MEILTPREVFDFACQLRLGLNEAETAEKVNFLIERLDLMDCSEQMIGGWMKRGISGGERKRVSIGHELITEPAIILLDEPTSGLDSQSAKRVIKQLRLEAQRGLSVLATIHQPSSEIFMSFDRVIVLAEGRTIYSGRPEDVRKYFDGRDQSTGQPLIGQFCNPADKLISIASFPRKAVPGAMQKKDEDSTKEEVAPLLVLEQRCRQNQLNSKELNQQEEKSAVRDGDRINIKKVVEARRVGFQDQFKLILWRHVVQAKRTPLAMIALIVNGIMQGFLQASMF